MQGLKFAISLVCYSTMLHAQHIPSHNTLENVIAPALVHPRYCPATVGRVGHIDASNRNVFVMPTMRAFVLSPEIMQCTQTHGCSVSFQALICSVCRPCWASTGVDA